MAQVRFEWDPEKDRENQRRHEVSFVKARFAFADLRRVTAEDLSHSSSEKRHCCFGRLEGGVLTARFMYRSDVIRIFGAGYGRRGKDAYEQENRIHGGTTRTLEDRP